LNVFFPEKPWLNTVYPTLAVEFEYYLLIGLLHPLLVHASPLVRRTTLGLFLLACFALPFPKHLPHYAPLFALGIIAYQMKTGLVGRQEGMVAAGLAALVALVGSDPLHVPVGLASFAVILCVGRTNAIIAFFGSVSYSVYLLHVPLGSRVINLGSHWAHTSWAKAGVLLAAFAVTIAGAWLLHRLIEKPSQSLSRRIKYPRSSL
jgi:peptidoglycan/LPS O-acetylase OafA/YrhL